MFKYIVLKTDDIQKYTGNLSKETLKKTCSLISSGRQKDGKNPENNYLVINSDEPYASQIYLIMHKKGHTPCADCEKETAKRYPLRTYCPLDCPWLTLRNRMKRLAEYEQLPKVPIEGR